MSNVSYNRSLHLFALLTGFCTLCLIVLGGLVTSHGVGMAVPDWPNTYGYNMFLFPFSQWVGGIFYEHTHRLLASFVGLLTAILALWLWVRDTSGRDRWMGVAVIVGVLLSVGVRLMPVYLSLATLAFLMMGVGLVRASRTGWSLRWLGMVALAAVVLQGVLGGLRVVWARDEIGVFHAALAQGFLVLLAVIALMTSQGWKEHPAEEDDSNVGEQAATRGNRSLNLLLRVTTGLIFLQLVIGATMRHQHAGLAIPDFPLAYGSLWPDMSPDAVTRYNQQRIETLAQNPITATQIALQMLHRMVACAIVGLVLWCAFRVRRAFSRRHEMRRLAGFWVTIIAIQFGLGAWTIWSNKAADIASLHVVCGALSLVTGGLVCVTSARPRRGMGPQMTESRINLGASLLANEAKQA